MEEKIIFDFELNTRGGQRSVNELKDRMKQLTKALADAQVGSKTFNDLNRELAKTRVELTNLNRMVNDTKLEVDIETLESDNSLAGLQNRLKLLKNEIRGVEIGSEEFKKLEAEIANVNIEMKGLKEGFRGLDFGAVLGEAGAVLSGAAGAVGMLNDALMDGNEESAKYIENATRTIMIMQGVQGVMAGVDSATKLLNITLEKNPILIWVAAAAALVGGLVALYKWIKSNNEEMDKMNNLTESQKNLLKALNTENIRHKLGMAEINKELRTQIDLKNQLIDMEFDKVVEDISKEFDVEVEAIKNINKNIKDYYNNLDKLVVLQERRNKLAQEINNASGAERNILLERLKGLNNEIRSLESRNKEYIKSYGSLTNFFNLNQKVSEEEITKNQKKEQTYKDLFKTIKDEGSEAYKTMASEIKKFQDDLNSLAQNTFDRRIALSQQEVDQKIEDAKRIGDIDKLVEANKEKLDIEIRDRQNKQNNLIAEYNEKRKQSNAVIDEHKKKILENNKAIEEFNKKYADMAGKTVPKSELEEMLKQRKEVEKLRDDLNKQYNEIKKGEAENVKSFKKELEQNTAIYKQEIQKLQEQSKRSTEEFVKEALNSMKSYNNTLKDDIYKERIEDYNDFLSNEQELLDISEQEKNDKIIKYLENRYGLEKSELKSKLKDDLSSYELYFKQLDKKYSNNFSKNIDLMLEEDGEREKTLDDLQKIIDKKMDETILNLNNNKLTEKGREVEKNKLEMLGLQYENLNLIKNENQKLNDITEKTSILYKDDVKTLRDYKVELEKINNGQKNAQDKEIEATLRSLMLNREKYNAILQMEALKLERYKGYLNKETQALKRQLEVRKQLELDTAKELYNRNLIEYEDYLENVEAIEEVYKRRGEEVEIERLGKILDISTTLYQGYFEVISNLQQGVLQDRLTAIETERDASIEALDEQLKNKLITDEQYNEQKKVLEKDAEQRQKKLQLDQAKRDKSNAIFQAVLGMIVGIAKSVPNPITMAAAAASGGVQVAAASSTPLPKFKRGGLIGGRSHDQGGTILEAEKNEIILNKRVRSNPVLNNIASMINEQTGGKSFRLPMGNVPTTSGVDIEQIVKSVVSGVKSIPVVNVATDTEKVNNSVKRLQNKAKL